MGAIAVCQVGFLTAMSKSSLMTRQTKLLLISCIHILILLILLYFRMQYSVVKLQSAEMPRCYLFVVFFYLCPYAFVGGFVLYFYSQSFSKYVTPRRTMKSMGLVFVVIIQFLESCHNAHPMEIRSLIQCC